MRSSSGSPSVPPTAPSGSTSNLAPVPGPSITVARAMASSALMRSRRRSYSGACSGKGSAMGAGLPVEGLDEEVDGAAAGEPDGERLVVGVAELHEARRAFTLEDGERLAHHRPFDAAAAHRSGDFAVVAHRHRRAGVAWAGALDVDNPRHRHPVAPCPPPFDVIQDVLHRTPLSIRSVEITRASSSNATNECPSTNASTYGRAAAIPLARGA